MANQNKNFSEEYKPEMCLDTNIIIAMSYIATQNKKEMETLQKQHLIVDLCQLMNQIEDGNIIAYATPTVIKELKQGENYGHCASLDYLIQDTPIKTLNMKKSLYDAFAQKTEAIATIYSQKIAPDFKNKLVHSLAVTPYDVTSCVFRPKKQNGEIKILNDARIMAEASQIGTIAVTNDYKDYIRQHRPEIISYLNQRIGLNPLSKPYSPMQINPLLRHKVPLPAMNKDWQKQLCQSAFHHKQPPAETKE